MNTRIATLATPVPTRYPLPLNQRTVDADGCPVTTYDGWAIAHLAGVIVDGGCTDAQDDRTYDERLDDGQEGALYAIYGGDFLAALTDTRPICDANGAEVGWE